MHETSKIDVPCQLVLSLGNIRGYVTNRGDIGDPDLPYDGFNVCHYTGDSTAHIAHCRESLCKSIGIGPDNLIIPRQTHSTNVKIVNHLPIADSDVENIDGLVTNLHDVVIGVSTADCVPVILADPVNDIIGVAHAGWRGAINGILGNVITAMTCTGASADSIVAAIGPSICVDCFEVGEEVASCFPDSCVEKRQEWSKPHVNLQKYVKFSLIDNGITDDHILSFNDDMCTRCNPKKYFSARRLGINSGRIFSYIFIAKDNKV